MITSKQMTHLTTALGVTPTLHQQALFSRLALYLNREPTAQEIGNMASDANLNMWVLTNQ